MLYQDSWRRRFGMCRIMACHFFAWAITGVSADTKAASPGVLIKHRTPSAAALQKEVSIPLQLDRLPDPAPAKNPVALVEDGRLAGRYRHLRRIEQH